jgi:hypothetical protein
VATTQDQIRDRREKVEEAHVEDFVLLFFFGIRLTCRFVCSSIGINF